MAGLRVSQVRSSIGTIPRHRSTLRALGLGRIGKSNVLPDRPEIRGMIAQVTHLVTVAPHEAGLRGPNAEAGLRGPNAEESA